MRGAIVWFENQGQSWEVFRRIKAETLCFPMEGKTCLLFTLPCTQDAFTRMTGKRKNCLVQRLIRRLKKSKVECVYAPDVLHDSLEEVFCLPDGHRIFCAVAGHIIERHCHAFSLTPEKAKVGIYENVFTSAGLTAAQYMTKYTKQLVLVSQNSAGAEQVAETLLEEYGLAARVTMQVKHLNHANVVLLLSAPSQEVLSGGLILDFSGKYPYRALRNYSFETAFGYAEFLRYFDRADCRAADFVLCCCDIYAEEPLAALEKIGWKTKRT